MKRVGLVISMLMATAAFAGTFDLGDIAVMKSTKTADYLDAKFGVDGDMPSLKMKATAYYFSEDDKLLASIPATPSVHKGETMAFFLPAVLKKDSSERLRFELPMIARLQENWKVVVCVGDEKEVTAKRFPSGSMEKLEFPEKKRLKESSGVVREKYENLLDEEVCPISLPDYPRMTLFAKLPTGLAPGEAPAGVLCISALAGGLDELRRHLQGDTDDGSMKIMLRYARKNKLMVICWGARQLWVNGKNWDDLSPAEAANIDARFEKVSSAWEKGVLRLTTKYQLKPEGFLLWGFSNSAQFAKRLALHKPGYFRAAYIHEPNSFDRPTPQAASIMWCLTEGELDGGYANSIRFFKKCQQLEYPMIYKVIPGLGHSTDVRATVLALHWFDYARTMPDSARERIKTFARLAYVPPFIGDYLNQEMEPSATGQWIPAGQRVSLPTEIVAKAWNLEKVPDPSDIPNDTAQAKTAVAAASAKQADGGAVLDAAKWPDSAKWPMEWQDWCAKVNSLKAEGVGVRDWPLPPRRVKMPDELKELKSAYDGESKRIRDLDNKLTLVFAQTMRDAGDDSWPVPEVNSGVSAATKSAQATAPQSGKSAEQAKAPDTDNTVFGRRIH